MIRKEYWLGSSLSLVEEQKFKQQSNTYNKVNQYLEWYNNSEETLWEQPVVDSKLDIRSKFGINKKTKIIFICWSGR